MISIFEYADVDTETLHTLVDSPCIASISRVYGDDRRIEVLYLDDAEDDLRTSAKTALVEVGLVWREDVARGSASLVTPISGG